jgi:DNA repair exonuclease SbcCD nuclease subunit
MVGFIHTADIHLYDNHKYSIDGSRLKAIYKNLLRMIKYISKKTCDVKIIIIAGDIFHTYNPPENLIKLFSKFIKIAAKHGVLVRVITGNHDTNGINYAFESLANINDLTGQSNMLKVFPIKDGQAIYAEIIENINFVYVPWQENLSKILREATKLRIKDKFNILTTHCAVDGALTNSDYEMKNTKITKSLLSGWDYVALGDFHTYQRIDENIYYSGNISKTVWDERHADKAFNYVEIDSLTGVNINKVKLPDSEFIELKIDYKQIKEYLEDDVTEINGKAIKGSFIKLFVHNQLGYGEKVIELKKHFIKCGAMDVYFKIIKSVEGHSVKSNDDGELNINLDLRSVCDLFLERNGIKNVNYKKYLENKIMENML